MWGWQRNLWQQSRQKICLTFFIYLISCKTHIGSCHLVGFKQNVGLQPIKWTNEFKIDAYAATSSVIFVFTNRETEPENVGWTDYLKSSAASLIPSTVSEVFNAWRDFATARLSEGGKRTICGVSYVKKLPHIVVADEDGMVHVFKLNTECGGECELVTTRR